MVRKVYDEAYNHTSILNFELAFHATIRCEYNQCRMIQDWFTTISSDIIKTVALSH